MSIRPVKRLIKSKPTLEGAGVHFGRAFAFGNTKDFESFLLLDNFGNGVSEACLAGFPWHPHRGIETITHCRARPLWGDHLLPIISIQRIESASTSMPHKSSSHSGM